jgi:uncharacterized membrane protein
MRCALVLVFGLVLVGLCGCESDGGDGNGESCNPTAPTECPADAPTYADVEPIFAERCTVCHGTGEDNQCPNPGQCWSLEDYGHVRDWTMEIRGALLTCTMPLQGSGITMTDTEREEILAWIRCGAPE